MMNRRIRTYYLMIFLAFSVAGLNAQGQCCDMMKRYVAALAYLRVDPSFDRLVQSTFVSSKKKLRQRVVTIAVSGQVRFAPLTAHENEILGDSLLSGIEVLNLSRRNFFDRFSFSTFQCDYLMNFEVTASSDVVIVFSNPFGDYLVAEVFDRALSAGGTVRNGRSISILFVFKNEIVENCYYNVLTF